MDYEYRNAHYSEDHGGYIDCEINHPEFGWLPTSVKVDGGDEATESLRMRILSENSTAELDRVLRDGSLVTQSQAEIDAEAAASLEAAKLAKINEMELKAGEEITSGFTSYALTMAANYGSKETDQLNLIGAVATGADMLFPCEINGTWSRVMHSNAQLQQVAFDGAMRKQDILTYLDSLRDYINALPTAEEVVAVIWEGP